MSAANLPAKPLSLMLVCGEPSGDQLGGELMAALKTRAPEVAFSGVGGEAMAAQGLRSLFPLDDTAVMGLAEVVPKIPVILKRVREAADYALETRPDAVVLIDSPDFTHRIARRLKRIDPRLRTVNYVAPQVWASRSYRAKAMARYFDLVLALLPFEPRFFESYGLKTIFVGHPVIERAARMKGGGGLRARLGIAPDAPLLAVLPGSRTNEVRLLLPLFRESVARLAADVPGLVCIIPVVPHVAARVREGAAGWPVPLHFVDSDADKFAAFDAADVALAASGTVTTELALSKTPTVVGYRLGWLTYKLMRPLIHAPYATLINIILGREAMPEFIQKDCTPEKLAAALLMLFRDEAARTRQLRDLEAAVKSLGAGGEAPSLRAAEALLAFAREGRTKAAV
ncbi:MAG: lipid-A-disaccharide synthase [Alphaproteobacteria bacterium]|nr:lipid-A-disaccharide synthase [Alphaproteobacteria bacterium]